MIIPQIDKINDFREDLQFSLVSSDEEFWEAIYRKAFPDMVGNILVNQNGQGQRLGIDRIITLATGKTLSIDEKKRRTEYPDILIEYISVDTKLTPGWIEKDLLVDYLAYAFMPSQRVYLFDWLMLKRAWMHYKNEWIDKYPRIEARNNGYKTISVAIPTQVLLDAVSLARIIQV